METVTVKILTMKVSRLEASKCFLEVLEGQKGTRAASGGASYRYFSAVIFDDLTRDGKSQARP